MMILGLAILSLPTHGSLSTGKCKHPRFVGHNFYLKPALWLRHTSLELFLSVLEICFSLLLIFARKSYMTIQQQDFLEAATKKAFDKDHRKKLNFNIGKYNATVPKGMSQYSDLELVRKKAKNIKWRAIENLDQHLIAFEANFTARGGKVIWAETAQDAVREIRSICRKHFVHSVVKSKSMVTEEIGLNGFLEAAGIEVNETDLGEYIVQLAGEKPYHIVTPAMHKSREDVAKLFHEKLGSPPDASASELTMLARKELREKYVTADAGITGANFLIADTGGIAITENEGNARLTFAFPKIHIAVVGIEKMIPSINDLSLYWPLLSTYGTGQRVTVFNSIITGPRQENETDGPEQMYVVLLDNGRSKLLSQAKQREALYCIRCGACLNACPVYKNIGGHSYGTTYSGPIGSVITPHLQGMEEFKHLSHASSLCGSCTAVCPVRIDLHRLLVYNRRDLVKKGMVSGTEKWAYFFWRKASLNRKLMNKGSARMKNFVFNIFFKNSWGKRKTLPTFPQQSFSEMWVKRFKK